MNGFVDIHLADRIFINVDGMIRQLLVVLNLILRKEMTVSHALLSLIGWENVGNSNWYIFCIICCYAFTYIAFKIA